MPQHKCHESYAGSLITPGFFLSSISIDCPYWLCRLHLVVKNMRLSRDSRSGTLGIRWTLLDLLHRSDIHNNLSLLCAGCITSNETHGIWENPLVHSISSRNRCFLIVLLLLQLTACTAREGAASDHWVPQVGRWGVAITPCPVCGHNIVELMLAIS